MINPIPKRKKLAVKTFISDWANLINTPIKLPKKVAVTNNKIANNFLFKINLSK